MRFFLLFFLIFNLGACRLLGNGESKIDAGHTPGLPPDSGADLGDLETDLVAPTVQIEEAEESSGPATDFPIEFEVVFSEAILPVTFVAEDVVQSGTASDVVWEVSQPDADDATRFVIRAMSASSAGTIVPTLAAAAVQDLAGNDSVASQSVDNSVTYAPLALFSTNLASTGAGVSGAAYELSVALENCDGCTYQWTKDGSPISGATNASMTLAPAKPSDEGDYQCVATKGAETYTSASHALSVSGLSAGWAITVDGTNYGIDDGAPVAGGIGIHKIISDSSGNVYVIGTFGLEVKIGGITLTAVSGSADYSSVFVAKYLPTGALSWLRGFGTSGDYYNYSGFNSSTVLLAPNGTLFLNFVAPADFVVLGGASQSLSVNGSSSGDLIVAAVSSAGVVSLAKAVSSSDTIDSIGSSFVVGNDYLLEGRFQNTLSFSGSSTTLTSRGSVDRYITRWNASAQLVWARSLGSTSSETNSSVAVNATGDRVAIYHSGGTSTDLLLNGESTAITRTGAAYGGLFMLNAANGNLVFQRALQASLVSSVSSALKFATDGSVWLYGPQTTANVVLSIDGTSDTLTNGSGYMLTLLGYAADGTYKWSKRGLVGVSCSVNIEEIRFDGAGGLVVGGYINGGCAGLTWDGGAELPREESYNQWLARYSLTDGAYRYSSRVVVGNNTYILNASSDYNSHGIRLATNSGSDGSVYFSTATFSGSAAFKITGLTDDTLTSDAALVRIGPTGSASYLKIGGASGTTYISKPLMMGNGSVWLVADSTQNTFTVSSPTATLASFTKPASTTFETYLLKVSADLSSVTGIQLSLTNVNAYSFGQLAETTSGHLAWMGHLSATAGGGASFPSLGTLNSSNRAVFSVLVNPANLGLSNLHSLKSPGNVSISWNSAVQTFSGGSFVSVFSTDCSLLQFDSETAESVSPCTVAPEYGARIFSIGPLK